MTRRLLCSALAALLITPVAFATTDASLTIYHANNDALFSGTSQGTLNAGHALVHEQRKLQLDAGSHDVRIGDLPSTLDPEAIRVGFGNGPAVTVLGQRVVLADGSAAGALDGATGQQVVVAGDTGQTLASGTLINADNGTLTVRQGDGRVVLVRNYATVTLAAGSASGGSTLLLRVDAKTAGTRNALLTYAAAGLGWRAAYTATVAGGSHCRMQFEPQASIANRSGHDYTNARIKLVAGQPNLGAHNVRMYSMAAAPAPMAAEARALPKQAALGDYRSFTLPGAVTLPNGTVTLTPLYASRELACQREYVVEDGGSGYPPHPQTNDYASQGYQDRAIASTLAFTAPDALPAGTLRAWINDRDGAPELLGEGDIADTPKDQRVAVQLGQSFDLRVSRERTRFHVDIKARQMSEAYQITLSNGGDSARTVTVREHPNRWREWTVTSSSIKASQQTPQLLEFKVPVPAHGKTVLDYAVRYTWTAKDM